MIGSSSNVAEVADVRVCLLFPHILMKVRHPNNASHQNCTQKLPWLAW